MVRSRVFVFWAITLFLSGFPSAEADGEDVDQNINKAREDVAALQVLTAEVLNKAQTKLSGAESPKTNMENHKTKAERAEADAKTAAGKITEANRKAEAEAVAQEAEKELKKCLQLYDAAKAKVDQASESLNDFVTRAVALNSKAKDEILPASSPSVDYAQVIASAATATTNTQTLSGEIDQTKVLSEAESALSSLEDSAKKVQIFKYQAESIAIVSNIKTKMSEAATIIQSIRQKKEEINTIVQGMNKNCKNAPDTIKVSLNSLCTNAGGYLETATNKVTEANKCNRDMLNRKAELDGDLTTLKDTTEEEKATEEAGKIQGHEELINGELQKIKEALGSAEDAFSSAERAQQQMQKEISQHSSQSGSELNEGKQTDNVHTAEVTNPITKSEAQNPKITETDKMALGKTKDTKEKTPEQPVDAHLDKAKENKLPQVTDKEKQGPKDDNSELLNNDKLRKIAKNMTNNSLIGGEVPTRSAANDSSVTVFIPLLGVLVISAVLH